MEITDIKSEGYNYSDKTAKNTYFSESLNKLNRLKFWFSPLPLRANLYLIVLADLCIFILAHFLSYCIRFEFRLTSNSYAQFFSLLHFIVLFKFLVFWLFGLYRGMWRYAGVGDMWRLFKATAVSSLGIIAAILFVQRFEGLSRAVFILDGAFTFLLTGGMRLGIRTFYQKKIRQRSQKEIPIFIIGAGTSGEKTLRAIEDNPSLPYQVIGFIDDSSEKRGQAIHGIPVLGQVRSLANLCELFKVKEALIAMPSASGPQMRRIVEICDKCGLKYKTLPSWSEIINGKVSIKFLRDVNYNDLLRRPPVELDTENIKGYLKGKTVLVSGAGGSIGSELCRQIIRFSPGLLILLDVSEANLYRIQMEFKHKIGFSHCVPILADVQNRSIIDRLFSHYQPHVVFHAAAYKHVPMMEENPWQAVHNNIRGTQTLMEQSVSHDVGHFVLISTDKAVRPTNIMGASKRVCELLMQSYVGKGKTRMMAVRFGNVLASSGSVIPLFREQIERGGPVTVTHPDVTRYFMTIPEATRLVLQAGALGRGGEIFVLNMGTAVKIADMARDLIRFSGKQPDRDIRIVFTGLRPGEKLYEELITEGEDVVATAHDKIMVLRNNNGYSKEKKAAFAQWLFQGLDGLYGLADAQEGDAIRKKLKDIVPEYACQESDCVL